jgi:alpha-aminoadipate/glutamate carrier protein LysW
LGKAGEWKDCGRGYDLVELDERNLAGAGRRLSGRKEAAMPSCPECESNLDIEMDEVEEGDVVACDECGTEFEIVGVEPLELARVGDELDEDEELFEEEEEE